HRIGRTARAGAHGEAISFGCEDYAQSLPDIEKYVGYTIPMVHVEPEMLAEYTRGKPVRRKPRPGAGKSRGNFKGHAKNTPDKRRRRPPRKNA
ncbi:MAG: RNA helicase, partial [Gammaproteobacteria bacterium]|nr:RNA helicase [Gammaproteobacteria bacterium]